MVPGTHGHSTAVDGSVLSTEQPISGNRRANTRRNVKGVERCGSVVPAKRTTHYCGGYPLHRFMSSSKCAYQTGRTIPRHSTWVVCPGSRDISPTNTDSGNRGNHGSRMVASQIITNDCFSHFRRRYLMPICLLTFYICLYAVFSVLAQYTCCVMRRSDVCLYNVIVCYRPKYTHVLHPAWGNHKRFVRNWNIAAQVTDHH